MFKKSFKLLVAGTLSLAMLLTGCSTGGTTVQATDTPKTEEKSDSNQTTANADIKAGFIYSAPVADGGFVQSHDKGRLYLEEQLGVQTVYKESVPETQEVEKVARDMIDQGCNVIFAVSFGYMDYIEKLSKEFPEVTFFHCSGYKTTENMANYFGRVEDARYITGMVAGLQTETNQIGYVAAMPIPEVIRGINAFTLGVKAVNPDAVVKVSWTNTWYDPAKEKEAGSALIDQGCDVLAQHQNAAGAQQAAEEKGVWSIGYHQDMSGIAPNANLVSAIWNWGPYYVEAVQSVIDGTFTPSAYWEGIDAGIVDISPLTANAKEGIAEIIEARRAEMKAGTFNTFQGPIKDQAGNERVAEGPVLSDEDQLSNDWFVEGVVGDIN